MCGGDGAGETRFDFWRWQQLTQRPAAAAAASCRTPPRRRLSCLRHLPCLRGWARPWPALRIAPRRSHRLASRVISYHIIPPHVSGRPPLVTCVPRPQPPPGCLRRRWPGLAKQRRPPWCRPLGQSRSGGAAQGQPRCDGRWSVVVALRPAVAPTNHTDSPPPARQSAAGWLFLPYHQ